MHVKKVCIINHPFFFITGKLYYMYLSKFM